MKLKNFTILLAVAIFVLASCEDSKKAENNPTEDLVYVGAQSDNGLTVALYSDAALRVGLNSLYFQLTDDVSGAQITEAHITQKPIMYMADMKHSCPVTNPEMTANEDGLFTGEIVFIMAGGMTGAWDDTVFVHNENANSMHKVVFSGLTVTETGMKKDLVFFDVDSNQTTYIVTLNGLDDPDAGSNDFTVTVHQKENMMSFPEVAHLDITVNPQMPDMGHGSTGNVNPVYVENGKYEGTVVFNMTGYWTIEFTFAENGETLGSVRYEINF